MRKLRAVVYALLFLTAPVCLNASEGLDVPESLENTVSLEGLTGLNLFVARAYNENPWLYAVYCTAAMAVIGILIAFLADLLLRAAGLQVGKMQHRE